MIKQANVLLASLTKQEAIQQHTPLSERLSRENQIPLDDAKKMMALAIAAMATDETPATKIRRAIVANI